jgi:hypothetical protein
VAVVEAFPCLVAVATAGPEAEEVDDSACFGRVADDAAQLEVVFSLNNGTITDGCGYDVSDESEDNNVAVELEVQLADVA